MPDPTTPPEATPPDDILEAEQADAAKTADAAPAPVHADQERDVLVRDSVGHDPYGGDRYGPGGDPTGAKLGQAPDELPDPIAGALRQAKERADGK